jgi:ABC-type nitrate/sulfonate/bicarbonate transport system permease component
VAVEPSFASSGVASQSHEETPVSAHHDDRAPHRQEARRVPVWVVRLGLILLWLSAWEASVRAELVNPILVAKPTSVVVQMFAMLGDPDIIDAFGTTLFAFVTGFAFGATAGIVLGVLLGLVRPLHRVLYGPLMVLYATPKSIFLPLFVVFLGLGVQSPAAFAAVETTFPLLIAVVAGIGAMDQRLLTAASALGASPLQRIRYVVLPSVVPPTISGIWLGLKQALLAVLLAELLISSGSDVGYYITFYASTFKPDQVYALVMWLSIFAVTVAFAWGRVEAYTQRWRSASRGDIA